MIRRGTALMRHSTADTTPGCVAARPRHHPSGSSGTPIKLWPVSRRRWLWPSSLPTPLVSPLPCTGLPWCITCLIQTRAEAAMAVATDQKFPQYLARTMPLLGWAWAACGNREEGITQIQQGLATFQATGVARDRPYHLALLAEVCAQGGQTTAGLEALAEAFVTLPKSGARWWEAELYRLRGELLLQHAVAQPEEAEACFQQALDIARRQQAKSLELRAVMSLSRLWQRQGKRAEGYELLALVYGWFTEGFDTLDLQEAKALLNVLRDNLCPPSA